MREDFSALRNRSAEMTSREEQREQRLKKEMSRASGSSGTVSDIRVIGAPEERKENGASKCEVRNN